jgi:PBP1b-binding outer membrane lipoprotein LpoB
MKERKSAMFESKHILHIAFMLCIVFSSCTSPTSPVIEVRPKEAMIDEPVSVRILKCPKNEPVILIATMFDDDSVKWVSVNTFIRQLEAIGVRPT